MGRLVMDIQSNTVNIFTFFVLNSCSGYKCKLPPTSYSQQSGEVIKFRFEVVKSCLE